MRRTFLFIVAVLACGLSSGCQDTPQAKKANENASREIKEAGSATAEALKTQQVEYRKKVESDLDKLDSRLDAWKAKAKEAKGDAKVALDRNIATLEEQRKQVREKLKDLKADTKDAWTDLKKGIDKSVDDLSIAFDKAKDNFK